MSKSSLSIRTFVLSVLILTVLLTVAPVAYAQIEHQDPGSGGGGGSGNLCWTQSCARCAYSCSEFGGCWWICDYVTGNGGCACWFESGSCSENGSCTYVP